MTWKIAQAKQNLSQVIRAAASEPRVLYNRNRPVAAVISGEIFARFEAWRREQERHRPLDEAFSELRALCVEDDYELPEIRRHDRPNPFAATASVHTLPLVTRNVKDFEGCDIEIVNPFRPE